MLIVAAILALLQAQPAPRTGVLQGVITPQGTVNLPGAQVTVTDSADKPVTQILSGEDGHFSVVGLAPGRYKVTASLASFVTASETATVVAGRASDLAIDLAIEGIKDTVEVVAQSPIVSSEGTLARTETISGKEIDTFASSGGLQATMRLLASVIEAPNGVSIRGGRPSPAGVQLGVATMGDPSTG